MTTATRHHGSCHCGAVSFSCLVDASQGITCNWSIGSRRGTILGSVPFADFTLEKGQDNLTEYQFGKLRTHHLFCKTCGVASFSWGTNKKDEKLYAVNLRCLDGFDETKVKGKMYDGKAAPLH